MAKKNTTQKLFSKRVLKDNKQALKSYEIYKKSEDIIDRVKIASGKKSAFVFTNNSSLNVKLDIHGISSTQKI